MPAFERFLVGLGYPCEREADNPAYQMFLRLTGLRAQGGSKEPPCGRKLKLRLPPHARMWRIPCTRTIL